MTTDPTPAPAVAGQRQLFVDDSLVEETHALTRVLHQPTKYAGNPIIRRSLPWERNVSLYGAVLYDPVEARYRMWYQGFGSGRNVGCYATSLDGIYWEKPSLGLVELDGSVDNNVVLANTCLPNVIHEPQDADPARRYKALFWDNSIERGPGVAHVSVAFSPDGIHWTKYAHNPVLNNTGDTHTLLGWDEAVGQYVAYPRAVRRVPGGVIRVVGRSVSDDFIHWTDPEVVMAPNDADPPGLEFYGMPVFKYEGLYLGLPWAFHTYPEEPPTRKGGTIDVQLAVSHDGAQWEHVADQQPFIPLGPPGSVDQGMVFGAKEPLVMGDELWFYYGASDGYHGAPHRDTTICLAKLRRDGFVSLDAADAGGVVLTKPLVCDGDSLAVNVDARGGSVAVAVLDEQGGEIPGYRMTDCALFDGDSVAHRITWREQASLAPLQGSRIRLKFYLRSARLYAFGIA